MKNLKKRAIKPLGECFVDSLSKGGRKGQKNAKNRVKWSLVWVWLLLISVILTFLVIGWVVNLRVVEYQYQKNIAKIDGGLEGKASWYGMESCTNKKCLTASGEVFDEKQLTCAYWFADFDSIVKVVNVDNEKEIMCRITDTGGFLRYGRIIDLSKRAFQELAPLSKGEINVKVYVNN